MKPWRRLTVALLGAMLAAVSTSCTHNPITNERIADSFEGCMGANTVISAGIGVIAKKLAEELAKGFTKDKEKAKDIGKAAGVTAFLGTVLIAWEQCAQAHQKVVNKEEKSREQVQGSGSAEAALSIDQFALTVGLPGQDINSMARYTVLANDPAKMDISVREIRTVQVPRVVKDQQGRLYYADSQDNLLMDSSRRPMPVDGKTPYDPNALVYKDLSFSVDNVVKQGMRKADGMLPTPKDLPDSIPYRLRFVVEAEGMRAEKEVGFRFAKPGQAAASFGAQEMPSSAASPSVVHKADVPPVSAGGWSGSTSRQSYLRETPGGKTSAQVVAGTLLVVVEGSAEGAKDVKSSEWVRVRTETGAVGWLRKTEIKGLK